MSITPSRSLVLSGCLGAALALVSLPFAASDVSEDVWNYPLPGGIHVAVSALLVIDHLLSAYGVRAIAGLGGLPTYGRRWLMAAAGGLVLLAACEGFSAFLVDEPTDGTRAEIAATCFGVATLVIAVPAVVGGLSVGRHRLLPSAAWSVAASGAFLLLGVTPANIAESMVVRTVALAIWSLGFVWMGAGLARSERGDDDMRMAATGAARPR
jgi:hypothetical protein